MGARGVEVDEERMLAGRLAGVLFLTAAAAMVLLLFVPGVEDRHWPWVVGFALVSVAWALYPDDAETIDELVAAADDCVRGAKLTGKNRALSAVDLTPAA